MTGTRLNFDKKARLTGMEVVRKGVGLEEREPSYHLKILLERNINLVKMSRRP